MNIVRDGKTYTLTEEEVAMAHAEFVVSFMEDRIKTSGCNGCQFYFRNCT